jgi:NTE family protein
MQAYAVFDGGGVKGAALAGCLKAAQESGIEFVGYGGTSAGSIVALLATVGYTGHELEEVMTESFSLGSLSQDLKEPMDAASDVLKKLADPGLFLGPRLWRHRKIMTRLSEKLGFTAGNDLTEDLYRLVSAKLKSTDKSIDKGFTFHDLKKKLQRPPLKIVASDLRTRKPLIFSDAGGEEQGGSVLDAVRASMSYPFAFQPMRVNDHYLVDGGLCSNLPVFLFDSERAEDRLPLLAFDLVSIPPDASDGYGLKELCLDMLETSLEAGDFLMRRTSEDIHHIQVFVPADISALDFDLPKNRLRELFYKGCSDTHEYIQKKLATWQQAQGLVGALQARHGSPEDVEFVLERFAHQLKEETGLTNVRTHIMLPTGRNKTRIIVFQYNMDNDPDQDLELSEDGGCSGKCWIEKLPTYADLVDAGTGDNYKKWKMTKQEQSKVKPDRRTMLSIPIFSPGSQERLIGVLSGDSDTYLKVDRDPDKIDLAFSIGKKWAVVLTSVLS